MQIMVTGKINGSIACEISKSASSLIEACPEAIASIPFCTNMGMDPSISLAMSIPATDNQKVQAYCFM